MINSSDDTETRETVEEKTGNTDTGTFAGPLAEAIAKKKIASGKKDLTPVPGYMSAATPLHQDKKEPVAPVFQAVVSSPDAIAVSPEGIANLSEQKPEENTESDEQKNGALPDWWSNHKATDDNGSEPETLDREARLSGLGTAVKNDSSATSGYGAAWGRAEKQISEETNRKDELSPAPKDQDSTKKDDTALGDKPQPITSPFARTKLGARKNEENGSPTDQKGQPKTQPKKPKEKEPAFSATHPKLTVSESSPPTGSSRLFNILALIPIVFLTALLAGQVYFSLDARELWYPGEVLRADILKNFLAGNNWFVLELNGQTWLDGPPLYYWLLKGVHEFLNMDGVFLIMLGAAASGALYLWSMIFLGRFAVRMDGHTILAGGIVLICSLFIVAMNHYASPEMMFSALVIFSCAFLYRAWVKRSSIPCMVLGFVLAALACLAGGITGLILPIAAGVLFLLWRGTPLRLIRLDTIIGLVVCTLVLGIWATLTSNALEGVGLGETDKVFNPNVVHQLMAGTQFALPPAEAWYHFPLALPVLFLPWTILLLSLPWTGLFGKNMRQGIALSRKPEGEGYAYLWCIVLAAIIVLPFTGSLACGKILPAMSALALILGRAVLQFSPKRAAFFRHSTAVFMILLGICSLILSLMVFDILPCPEALIISAWELPVNTWFFVVSGGLILSAFLLWLLLRSSRVEGVLLVLGLSITALAYPLTAMIAPSLDPYMSPKTQALAIKELADKGSLPVALSENGKYYSYYADMVIEETSAEKIKALSADCDLAITARLDDWNNWADRPTNCKEVRRQWLGNSQHVLMACQAVVMYVPAEPDAGAPLDNGEQSPAEPSPVGALGTPAQDAPPAADGETQPAAPLGQE